MLNKLDLESFTPIKPSEAKGHLELSMPDQIEKLAEVKQAIDSLSILIESKEDYDFDQLKEQLSTLNAKLELEPLFKSLEKSLKEDLFVTSQYNKELLQKHSAGFSKLMEVYKQTRAPVVNVKSGDLASEYRGSDSDISEVNSYFGFLHPSGRWYIVRQSGGDSSTFRYVSGAGNYRQGWAKRNQHDYKYFNEINL